MSEHTNTTIVYTGSYAMLHLITQYTHLQGILTIH